jgi:NAD(P)H-dependent flavin oxidoreductase YrpB (nitropropane dioxygenase family)
MVGEHRVSISKEEIAEELRKDAKAAYAAYQGDIDNGGVLIRQSIGTINKVESVSDIIDTIVKYAEKSLKTPIKYVQ